MTETYHHNALPLGSMLQEYKLLEVLGEGSFGIVYLAEGTYLGEKVAIKEYLPTGLALRSEGSTVLPTSSEAEDNFRWGRQKFLEEAQMLWQLAHPQPHPHIVAVRRFFEENGTAYMVMDLVEGDPLSTVVKREGKLPEKDLLQILFPLLDGLEVIHKAGIRPTS
jgi:serine/threonine protein kinase